MTTIDVLWTGGLDSTFLVASLCAHEDIAVQPYYIIDEARRSTEQELKAIRTITDALRRHPATRGELCDVRIFHKADIAPDEEVMAAWQRERERVHLGKQYAFIARFARQQQLNLAVGILFCDRGAISHSMGDGGLAEQQMGSISFLHVPADAGNDAATLFGRLLFPTFMRGMEKPQEWQSLHDMGYGEVAAMTWFCHRPVCGLPCGHCSPCRDALNEGMAFRVPVLGRILGTLRIS